MAFPSQASDTGLKTQLASLRHDDKWEILKPVLRPMYEKSTVKEIAREMKRLYGFDANEQAYQFRFKKWKWGKNFTAATKEEAIRKVQRRANQGKSSKVVQEGRLIDPKRLERQAKSNLNRGTTILEGSQRLATSQAKTLGDFLPFGNRIFVYWNMPFGLNPYQHRNSPFGTSPPNHGAPSPGNVEAFTPQNCPTPPANHTSPRDYISPGSVAIQRRSAHDWAGLLLCGRFDEAVSSMNDEKRAITSKWLYQFWHFAFVTAKYWGSGIRSWTSQDLKFDEYDKILFRSAVASPRLDHSPGSAVSRTQIIPEPGAFCRYAIHIEPESVNYVDGLDHDHDPENNEKWPGKDADRSLEDHLCEALNNNQFSNIPTNTLPIALDHVARAAEKSPSELMAESITFAIMARNFDLVIKIFKRAKDQAIDLSSTYYLHVATSYLDGASTCCLILDYFCNQYQGRRSEIYVNEHGHTVLDNLILTILKGHSRTSLHSLDDTLRRQPRFAGVEVDLCGRWDADSHCYRSLLQAGKTAIPFHWKHKFCHSSIQAVWHCIVSLDLGLFPLDTESGLFIKHCTNSLCGKKLQLGPLHALTMAAFFLAQDGCEDEDLFGMCAVLTCLISCGLSGTRTAHISVPLLFGEDSGEECSHADITPLQLAQSLPQAPIGCWSAKKQVGWQIFCHILRLAIEMNEAPAWVLNSDSDSDSDSNKHWRRFASAVLGRATHDFVDIEQFPAECDERLFSDHGSLAFKYSNQLGHLWAAFQAEVLTHRKQKEDDPWVSERFDMDRLLKSLETNSPISIPILSSGAIAPYCRCGKFEGDRILVTPTRQMVMESYFGNMDIWERSTFIDLPPRLKFHWE